MKRRGLLAVLLGLCFAAAAYAQEGTPVPAAEPQDESCQAEPLDLAAVDWRALADTTSGATGLFTETERRVQEIVSGTGLHVVHFWAPWCANSEAELRQGWYDLIEKNPDVTFTFVTVWNDGQSGREVMDRYAIPASVVELTQADLGPSEDETKRRRQFMGLPMTWIPATWIFHQNGRLAFALNAGEMDMATLQHLLDATKKDWSRD
jgi:hypothetical protein